MIINGMPVAMVGDGGFPFFCCAHNLSEIAMGSSVVNIEGDRVARMGDITAHCAFPHPPKPPEFYHGLPKPPVPPIPIFPGDVAAPGIIMLGSFNVFIGGFPLPSFKQMAMKALFKGLMKGLGKLKDLIKKGWAKMKAKPPLAQAFGSCFTGETMI